MKNKEYENLVNENKSIEEQKRKLKFQLKELNSKQNFNELKMKSIKSQISSEKSISFEREFMNISKAILDEKTYSKIVYLTFEKIDKE